MVETIVVAIQGVSYIVILIIMAVAANTMAMTARERLSEYATLKALGFKPGKVAAMIMGSILACDPRRRHRCCWPRRSSGFCGDDKRVRECRWSETFYLQACAVVMGLVAGVVPAGPARVKIVDGLRHVA
jgi:putative ABC transport system permease protein